VRDLFLLAPDLVFLNHGSFGACPAEVLDAQQAVQREMERNPVEFLGRRSATLLAEARALLAAYLGAQARDLVFVANATTGVNVAARSARIAPGDEVVTTDLEYGACEAAWERVCDAAGARLVRARIPLPFRPDELEDRLFAAVTAHTRVIALSHVTSTTALVLPIAGVCRRARESGVLSVVDGAHAPGQVPLALDALGADFYTGNCHKWLCAPKGAAFLHVRREHHVRVESPLVSWGYRDDLAGDRDIAGLTGTTTLERRLQWLGTRDLSAFLAVPAALDFLACHDWETRRRDCHDLAVETRDRIDALTGLEPICAPEQVGAMAAVRLPQRDAVALRTELFARRRIEVPIGFHEGVPLLRVSFHLYNTRADADALLTALGDSLRCGARDEV
jgi:isopenicillin-N epimerase